MKNIKNCILFFWVFFFFISCTSGELNKEIEVINDSFLEVVGTVAYHELSLRPPPPDPENKDTLTKPIPDNLAIIVSDTLFPIKNWADNLVWLCKGVFLDENDPLKDLQNSLCNEKEENGDGLPFKVSRIKDIGKYSLITEKNKSESDYIIVGKVQFSRVALNVEGTLAGFVAVISVNERAGIVKLFVLSKEREKWEVLKTEILSIW